MGNGRVCVRFVDVCGEILKLKKWSDVGGLVLNLFLVEMYFNCVVMREKRNKIKSEK